MRGGTNTIASRHDSFTNYQVLGPLVLRSNTAPQIFDQNPLQYPIDSAVADDYAYYV